jgi:alpha-tubulin suppressor-like RCC1 family protein
VWVLSACQPHEVSLSLRFQEPATRLEASAILLRILEGGCSGTPVHTTVFPASDPESAATPPRLARGTYGFEVEARDEACQVLAQTCATRELPLEQGDLEVVLPDVTRTAACEAAQCTRGVCRDDTPPDAGMSDDPDGGTEACSGDDECPGGRCRDGACCTGCWNGSSCEGGGSAAACGSGGDDCASCGGDQSCVAGACVSGPPVSLALSPVTSYVRIGAQLWSAGSNAGSQRGELVSAMENVFSRQDTDVRFADVAAAQLATCGIDVEGTLHCWGSNAPGLLGIGSSDFSRQEAAPQAVGSDTWLDVEAGNGHFCAIRDDGRLFCWGTNGDGQCGVSGGPQLAPTEVEAGGTWSAVAPGDLHTCAIRSDGALFCWGSADAGKLGVAGAMGGATAVRVGTATDWVAVSAGVEHTCGIRGDATGGELFCWGTQEFGRLGDGISTGTVEEPKSIDASQAWVGVAAGQFHSCALTASGEVHCWGVGARGATGLEPPGDADVPTRVPGVTADAIAVGWTHTCAASIGGGTLMELRCWGDGTNGLLGDGGTEDQPMPVTPTLDPSP